MSLYLIATKHDDFVRGPVKLRQVYDRIKPDVLLSEMDESYFLKRDGLCKKFVDGLGRFTSDLEGLEMFADFILNRSLGFEYPFNQCYSKEKGIPNILIDLPGGSKTLFMVAESAIDETIKKVESKGKFNPRKILSYLQRDMARLPPKEVRESWKRIKRDENGIFGELRQFFYRFTIQRPGLCDRYMEQRIREIYDPSKTTAFTVGMLHVSDSLFYNTVYSRIKDLYPERIPLIE